MTDITAMCPPEHPHGAKTTCYAVHRCRCEPCGTARAEYVRNRNQAAQRQQTARQVPSLGTIRRLRGLVWLGWPPENLANRLDLAPELVWNVLIIPPPTVSQRFAQRVTYIFNRLITAAEPETKDADRAKRIAHAQAWPSAFFYDDIDSSENPRARKA